MGQKESKLPLLTDTPWRQIPVTNQNFEQSLIEDIMKLNPPAVPGLLLMGPIAAGKSSFINSCLTIGAKRKKAPALTGSDVSSYTRQFRQYHDSTLLKHFRLRDCMGIEQTEGEGFHPRDIVNLLHGHVKNSYTFDPEVPLTTDSVFYEPYPKFEDKTHCVVFVVDARVMNDGIPSQYVRKIKRLQAEIQAADVQRVLILTKVDTLCDKVEENASNIFRSIAVREATRIASATFCIEMASIHPVVNYESEYLLTTEQNIPILLALRQILQYASDKVEQILGY